MGLAGTGVTGLLGPIGEETGGGREAEIEAHLFLQITSTCGEGGGCGATFDLVFFLAATCGCGCDEDGDNTGSGAGEGEWPLTCSPPPLSSVLFLLGIFSSSREGWPR
jgi:hypothetical protein